MGIYSLFSDRFRWKTSLDKINIASTLIKVLPLVIIALLIFSPPAIAQEGHTEEGRTELRLIAASKESSAGKFGLNKEYFTDFYRDSKNIVTSPVRWGRRDWLNAALVVGSTSLIYSLDDEIRDFAVKERSGTSEGLSDIFVLFGDGKVQLPTFGLFYLYGEWASDERATRTAFLGLESYVVSGLFTQAIKYSTHRSRPSSGDGPDSFRGPSFSLYDLSFSSGHSASAFSFATVIASEYKDKRYVPALAYALATVSALSRIHDDKHWASDVLFGSLVGHLTARAIISYHNTGKEKNITLLPSFEEGKVGISVNYRYF